MASGLRFGGGVRKGEKFCKTGLGLVCLRCCGISNECLEKCGITLKKYVIYAGKYQVNEYECGIRAKMCIHVVGSFSNCD